MSLGEDAFSEWGWRIPFLVSTLMVGAALFIRWKMKETPLFTTLKKLGKTSTSPLKDSLMNKKNWKLILVALFGVVAGEAVIWYTAQFYALYFLQTVIKIDFVTSSTIMLTSVAIGTPLFIFFGWLSDEIGRKKILMIGFISAAVTLYPIYLGMVYFSNPLNFPALVALVLVQLVYASMAYGPMAALLVELFPAKIRYTSLSVPYHIGNGEFGGFTPLISTTIVKATGNIYAGLAWPISIASLAFIVGMRFLKETKNTKIWEEEKQNR